MSERKAFVALIPCLDHDARRPDAAATHASAGARFAGLHRNDSASTRAFRQLVRCRRFTRRHLFNAHATLAPHVVPAGLRRREPCVIRCPSTRVVTYTAPPALAVPALLDMLLAYVEASRGQWHEPYVVLLLLLVIHPFPDGNGRTARVLFAALCWRNGHPHPAFLRSLRSLWRHEATAIRAGSAAVVATGDWDTWLGRCALGLVEATGLDSLSGLSAERPPSATESWPPSGGGTPIPRRSSTTHEDRYGFALPES